MNNFLPIIGIAGNAGSGKDTAATWLAQNYNGIVIAQADPLKRFAKDIFGFSEEQLWGPSILRNIPDETLVNRMSSVIQAFNDHAMDWLEEVFPNLDSDVLLEDLEEWFNEIKYDIFEKPIAPRKILQTLGTDFGRAQEPDVWSRYALDVCAAILDGKMGYSRTEGISDSDKNANFTIVSDVRFRNEIMAIRCLTGLVLKIDRRIDHTATESAGVVGHVSETELDSIPSHFYSQLLDNNGSFEQLHHQLRVLMHDSFGVDKIRKPGIIGQ
jgi:hypothetical protein